MTPAGLSVYMSGRCRSYICEEMSRGNQKVVRVTCQCIGISPRISSSADCQLVVCGGRDVRATLAMLRRIPAYSSLPTRPELRLFSFIQHHYHSTQSPFQYAAHIYHHRRITKLYIWIERFRSVK